MFPTVMFCFCLYFASHISTSFGQCSSENEIAVNEASIGSTIRDLIDGSSNFAFDIFKTIQAQEHFNTDRKGIFFSPFSIWSILMITYMGAQSETEIQLQNALRIGNFSKDSVWGAYTNILNINRQLTPQESYTLANKLYFQTGTEIKKCVRDMITSELDFANFAEDPETARSSINQWVERETQNKIQDLIPSGGVNVLTKMVIANAVYFKENWASQFDSEKTKPRRFTLPSRRDMLVNMMNIKGRFHYGASEELQCTGLELPYKGNELSMLILLPKNRYHGIGALATRLTAEKLEDFLADMYPREAIVSLPKFKLEDQFELSSILNKMGLTTLFNSHEADLSGFTDDNDLSVDAIYHKSFVEVNEEGTEAAAATASITSRAARPLSPVSFIADFPFVFLIRDNVANVILFMGAVQKPDEYKRNTS